MDIFQRHFRWQPSFWRRLGAVSVRFQGDKYLAEELVGLATDTQGALGAQGPMRNPKRGE